MVIDEGTKDRLKDNSDGNFNLNIHRYTNCLVRNTQSVEARKKTIRERLNMAKMLIYCNLILVGSRKTDFKVAFSFDFNQTDCVGVAEIDR